MTFYMSRGIIAPPNYHHLLHIISQKLDIIHNIFLNAMYMNCDPKKFYTYFKKQKDRNVKLCFIFENNVQKME